MKTLFNLITISLFSATVYAGQNIDRNGVYQGRLKTAAHGVTNQVCSFRVSNFKRAFLSPQIASATISSALLTSSVNINCRTTIEGERVCSATNAAPGIYVSVLPSGSSILPQLGIYQVNANNASAGASIFVSGCQDLVFAGN